MDMASEYQLRLWTVAVAMYEESDKVGIPLHTRPPHVRDAWREAARKEMNRAAAP
jgi:hypothetical protein